MVASLVFNDTLCTLSWILDVSTIDETTIRFQSSFRPTAPKRWQNTTTHSIARETGVEVALVVVEEKTADAVQIVSPPSIVPISSHCPNQSPQWIQARTHLLLSCVQKAVRLRQTDTCLRSLWLLMYNVDSNHLLIKTLKRLCIIITEDATLHPIFPYIVFFFLAASKGWTMTDRSKSLVLQGMQCLGDFSVPADWRCHFGGAKQTEDVRGDESEDTVIVIDDMESITLRCIWWRASMGGMHSDMKLLEDVHLHWQQRWYRLGEQCSVDRAERCWIDWKESRWYQHTWWAISGSSIEEEGTQWAWQPKRDEIKSAVDMHCSSILVYLLQKCNIHVNDYLRLSSLIWDRRSSLRRRVCTCGEHVDDETLSVKRPATQDNPDPDWWTGGVLKWIDHTSSMVWKNVHALGSTIMSSSSRNKSRHDILIGQLRTLATQRGEKLILPETEEDISVEEDNSIDESKVLVEKKEVEVEVERVTNAKTMPKRKREEKERGGQVPETTTAIATQRDVSVFFQRRKVDNGAKKETTVRPISPGTTKTDVPSLDEVDDRFWF